MEVKCTNKKCLYEWNYKGKVRDSKGYITCSKCHYRIQLNKALDLSINHSLTHSLTHKQPLEIAPISSPYIEAPKEIDEEEFLDQEELFTEIIIKLCNKHNLPGRYDDYDLEWKCKECIELQIENAGVPVSLKKESSYQIREIKSSHQINQLSYPMPIKDTCGNRLIN